MTETLPLKLNWLRCPRCGGKTRTQLRPHTVLEDFPLFCPKCRYTCVIRFQNGKTEEIEMPDAYTQCRPQSLWDALRLFIYRNEGNAHERIYKKAPRAGGCL